MEISVLRDFILFRYSDIADAMHKLIIRRVVQEARIYSCCKRQ